MNERIEMKGTAASTVRVADWQARADELRALMLDAGHDPATVADDLRTAFGDITFVDTTGAVWRHDGQAWWCWRADAWAQATPPDELHLESVVFELPPVVQPWAEPAAGPAVGSGAAAPGASGPPTHSATYRATHRVPAAGMLAWAAPDPATPASATLDPWLDVQLLHHRPDGWAQVRCSNGWEAWVDGRALIPG